VTTAALLALAGLLIGGALDGVSRRPDLVESAVFVPRQTVVAAGSVRLTDTARNQGSAPTSRSTTAYYLSRERNRDRGARHLGNRLVSALRPGATSRGSVAVTIPRSTLQGSYRVLACADDRHRVRESNEANNCRASSVVEVTAAPGADRSPPRFAGLKAATTCIPGPIVRGRTSSYHLRWDPASDNVTPSSEIVYDVFQSTKAGDEKLSTPTYTTPAGAESFTTPPLSADATYFFLVRARDGAGNRDSNRVERVGENICL
jgi:hypothetical protein